MANTAYASTAEMMFPSTVCRPIHLPSAVSCASKNAKENSSRQATPKCNLQLRINSRLLAKKPSKKRSFIAGQCPLSGLYIQLKHARFRPLHVPCLAMPMGRQCGAHIGLIYTQSACPHQGGSEGFHAAHTLLLSRTTQTALSAAVPAQRARRSPPTLRRRRPDGSSPAPRAAAPAASTAPAGSGSRQPARSYSSPPGRR